MYLQAAEKCRKKPPLIQMRKKEKALTEVLLPALAG
jgi:hypothetical protein